MTGNVSTGEDADGLALTVLTCAAGLCATKRVIGGPDGARIVGYDRAKHFATRTERFGDVHGLHRLLLRQDLRPREFLIRAALRPGLDPRRVRRTLHPDPTTGEAACFLPVPRAWAAFDFDSVPEPPGLDPAREPLEAGMFLRDLLPDPFPEAACVVQATSGCGFKRACATGSGSSSAAPSRVGRSRLGARGRSSTRRRCATSSRSTPPGRSSKVSPTRCRSGSCCWTGFPTSSRCRSGSRPSRGRSP